LLLEQLHDFGIDISSGQPNNMITENLDDFHDEKDMLLRAGIKRAQYIQTDDTKARHADKNGYCTHIGNELFAWFESTESKSRIRGFGQSIKTLKLIKNHPMRNKKTN
jgi:hypothetical protein